MKESLLVVQNLDCTKSLLNHKNMYCKQKNKYSSESLGKLLISRLESLKLFICQQYCTVCYFIFTNTRVRESVAKFKTIYGCSCSTAFDLSDCLTHTVGER